MDSTTQNATKHSTGERREGDVGEEEDPQKEQHVFPMTISPDGDVNQQRVPLEDPADSRSSFPSSKTNNKPLGDVGGG